MSTGDRGKQKGASGFCSGRSLWKRWDTKGDENPPFHEFCSVNALSGDDPEDTETPWTEDSRLAFLDDPLRELFKYTPAVLVVVLLVKAIQLAWFDIPWSSISGWSLYVSNAGLPGRLEEAILPYSVIPVGIVVAIAIVGLEFCARSDDPEEVARRFSFAVLFYTVLGLLVGGTAVSIWVEAGGPDLLAFRDLGYWLLVFLGGLLIYDGMLRTEHLFWCLGSRDLSIVETPEIYESFRHDLAEALGSRRRYVFALGLALPFALLDVIHFARGPVGLGTVFGSADSLFWSLLREGFNFVTAVVAFQFLTLTRYFYKLTTNTYEDSDGRRLEMTYKPEHPDGYGGYRDLGRFATRVNAILILGGLFLGLQVYLEGFAPETIGGLVGYSAVSLAWLYFGFWSIHRRMQAGLHERRLETTERYPNAPVWPVSQAELRGILSANLVPILLAVPRLFVMA